MLLFGKCDDGKAVGWMNLKWLNFSANNAFHMKTKSSLSNEENFRTVSFAKRGRQYNVEHLEPLYTYARRINPAKVADLNKLLPFVPPIFHPFYLAIKPDLKDNTEIETHPDIVMIVMVSDIFVICTHFKIKY